MGDNNSTASMTYASTPIPIENSRQVAVLVISSLAIAIPTIAVSLRSYARYTILNKFSVGDWLMIVALVSNQLAFVLGGRSIDGCIESCADTCATT